MDHIRFISMFRSEKKCTERKVKLGWIKQALEDLKITKSVRSEVIVVNSLQDYLASHLLVKEVEKEWLNNPTLSICGESL